MNYQKIHDSIIERARCRIYDTSIHHNHHVVPRHEEPNSTEVVPLTFKEHALIHKLRYKLGFGIGNLKAFIMLSSKKNPDDMRALAKGAAKLSAKAYHEVFSKRYPDKYKRNQSNAGKTGGRKATNDKKGFHALTKEQIHCAQTKGRKTTVEKKLGMFSDEYREKHRLTLLKKVICDGIEFDSMNEAAKHYGVCCSTITYRVNSKNERWSNWFLETHNE